MTLDPRLPFPKSVGGIFHSPVTTQKVYQGIEWFSQLAGLQWLTVSSMLIRGITNNITGDWHRGQLAALSPSFMLCLTLFWLRVKFNIFLSCDVRTHQNDDSALKQNCNVMSLVCLYLSIYYTGCPKKKRKGRFSVPCELKISYFFTLLDKASSAEENDTYQDH